MRYLALTFALILMISVSVWGDIVYLTNGNILHGTVNYKEDLIEINLGPGLNLAFSLGEVLKVESGPELIEDTTSEQISEDILSSTKTISGTVELPTPVPFYMRAEPKNKIPEVDWSVEVPEVYTRQQIQEARLRGIPRIFVKGKLFILQLDGSYKVEGWQTIQRKQMEQENLANWLSSFVFEASDEMQAQDQTGGTLYTPGTESEGGIKPWNEMTPEERSEALRRIYGPKPQIDGNIITLPGGSYYRQIQLPTNQ